MPNSNNAQAVKNRRSPAQFIVKYGVYSIFVVIIVIFALSNSRFLSRSNIMLLLEQINGLGITTLIATHDREAIRDMDYPRLYLRDGILENGE